jgi:hypothetical protein
MPFSISRLTNLHLRIKLDHGDLECELQVSRRRIECEFGGELELLQGILVCTYVPEIV